MPRISISLGRRGRWVIFALAVLLVAGSVLVATRGNASPAPIATQNAVIDVPSAPGSVDRVHLDATLYTPEQTPAPAILVAHGFGGSKESVAGQAQELAERGFVVLTYSARGFGHSTGQISLNDPDYEVADAQRLIDYLAARPEVLQENGDPKIGVTGASYGGALALLLAGKDKRVDAIAPVITYNDLSQALTPNAAKLTGSATDLSATPAPGAFATNGVFKRGWAGLLFSAGASSAGGIGTSSREAPEAGQATTDTSSGLGSSSGSQPTSSGAGDPRQTNTIPTPSSASPAAPNPCGRFTAEICQAYNELATTGRASQQTIDLLKRLSPASVTADIAIPALLVQGENDTLFGLDQSDATARQLTKAGAKVDMIWYAGGHDGGSPGPALRGKIANWLHSQLNGEHPTSKTSFSYDIQGSLRASGAPSVRAVEATTYPGLNGDTTERRHLPLSGQEQIVVNPPGGNPASVTGIPGLNGLASSSSQLSGIFSVDPPGQSARFSSAPMDSQLLVTGASTVTLTVSTVQFAGQSTSNPSSTVTGSSGNGEAVLFAKLYDVGPDGSRVLPGNSLAPLRIPDLPSDGTPREITVTLPGVVRPVEAGHSLQLVVSTTDQSYSTPITAAAYRISLSGNGILSVPVVPGKSLNTGWPVGQVLAIVGVLVAALAAGLVIGLRRKRAGQVDPDLTSAPLVISDLTKTYSGGLVAVRDLSFRVESGQVLGLLGPNGAGKTTTLRMLMGLITPTKGQITVFGHQVRPGAPVLSQVGSFVEGSGFLPHLSGKTNLKLYWEATGRPIEKGHIAQALEIAGLGDAIDRKVRTYSQGMRQRLAIAQAMLGLPNLLVLDEPANGLDPPQIYQMREVLRRYAETGRTVVVSSHLLAEVEQTCTHVVVMHRGALVASGTVAEIVAGGGEVTFEVDQPELAVTILRSQLGVSLLEASGTSVHADLSETSTAEAIAVLVHAGVNISQAGPRRRLEEVFLQLVGGE